jgi:hypothetical protein
MEVGSWLASLGITGAIAVGAAWALFQWLGKKWVEDHFSKELEAFKAEKQVELELLRTEYGQETERLKADLNRFADRASRFHVREYEVLPEAWGLMNKAYGSASGAISAFQQYPDLNNMSDSQFAEWLERSSLEQYQKEELRRASDKNKDYSTMKSWKQLADAEEAVVNFVNYIILQGFFIDETLATKMMNAGQNMRNALISRSMVERTRGQHYVAGQTDFWQEARKEIEAVEPVVLEVKQEVRQRLSHIQLTPPKNT